MSDLNLGNIPAVNGAESVAKFFGGWPSFHDSELVSVTVSRDGNSFVDIQCIGWSKPYQVAPAKVERSALVRFEFELIESCELSGQDVHVQNVLSAVAIEMVRDGISRLTFDTIFGLGGWIEGRLSRVHLLVDASLPIKALKE